ncbi:MAG: hypothetical protein M1818_007220 [Claussenomyces sp. TS43310]|nr:MAG: hypothetical protein M1818_007220 [Claussenomyces sp. TS43310]
MPGLGDCCPSELPPIVTDEYTAKGNYETLHGLKTYITGASSSTRGLVFVYDVFGFAPQTLQGADRLADSLGAVVLMPDILRGEYAQEAWFTSDDMADQRTAFMTMAAPPKHTGTLVDVAREAAEKYPAVKGWGALGLCWGGKVVALASDHGPFCVSGQAHPGAPTKDDAEKMTIPHICLAAPSDNKDGGIDGYGEAFGQEGSVSHVETYEKMHHGWMGARADLQNEDNAKEFERGYAQVAAFFAKHF